MSLRPLLAAAPARDIAAVFRLSLVAYVLFSALDWLTTSAALARGGSESNPLADAIYMQYGSAGLLLLKAAVVGLIVAALILVPRRLMSIRVATWVATAFAAVIALTCVHNLQMLAALR